MFVKEALTFGKVSSQNSKMPGTTYAVDAFACKTGSKLAAVEGTSCHRCYARKLQKLRPSVNAGWKANLAKWQASSADQWAQAIAFQIKRYNTDGFHRWFDAGDLQSVEMLAAIVEVCLMTPTIRHWLPTQERAMVEAFTSAGGVLPENLTIRVSASLIGGKAKASNTSNVIRKGEAPSDWLCEASTRGNQCGDCRACWDKNVANVSYPLH